MAFPSFLNELYGALELTRCFLSSSRRVVGDYGGAQINDQQRRFVLVGEQHLDVEFRSIRDAVNAYRGAEQHQRTFIRVGDRVPRREIVEKYCGASELPAASLQPDVVETDFTPVADVAADLLQSAETTVASVAAQVGYESEAAFSRAFKRVIGSTPRAARGGDRPSRLRPARSADSRPSVPGRPVR